VWLRWVLCEAAQTARRHPGFAATYQAIARRRGKKIATTAIARKLLARAWHLLAGTGNAASPSDQAMPAPARARNHQPEGITKPRASSQKPMSRPRRAR
jgi:hypothetical protein